MKKKMDVYFHGEREGADWRGQVIGNDGSVKARTSNLHPTQERAVEAVRAHWDALQKQLSAVTVSLAGIRRRLDAIAIEQLRVEVARLADENETLRGQLAWAEDAAEAWRADALDFQMELCEQSGGAPGITQTGALVVIPSGGAA